jgi:hypothetical protein
MYEVADLAWIGATDSVLASAVRGPQPRRRSCRRLATSPPFLPQACNLAAAPETASPARRPSSAASTLPCGRNGGAQNLEHSGRLLERRRFFWIEVGRRKMRESQGPDGLCLYCIEWASQVLCTYPKSVFYMHEELPNNKEKYESSHPESRATSERPIHDR